MSNYDHILAKSIGNGGTTLKLHLESVTSFALKAAGYAGLDAQLVRMGAMLHDIGKASPLFQKRLNRDYRPSPLERSFRHEIASLFFLKLVDVAIWPQMIDMIIAHHKSVYKDARMLGLLDLDRYYGEDNFRYHATGFAGWSVDALGILRELEFPGITSDTKLTEEDACEAYHFVVEYCKNKKQGWSEWKGVLSGADHIASATEEFKDKLPALFSCPDIKYYNRKCDLYPLSLVQSDKQKCHTFVKAPTGAGKTDFLLKRCRGRIFYTLPFQASINAMYERICSDLKNTVTDVRLLHSVSQLELEGNQFVEEAIQDKFGAAIKILTPHQLASVALGTRGYEAILFDVRGCDIIFDEIHTYSDIMQSIVLKMIEVLMGVGCRIHVGTATMPSSLEQAIMNILSKDTVQYVALPEDVLNSFNRHIVHKVPSMDCLLHVIRQAVKDEQKILIVCNRVANAQAVFNRMDETFPDVMKMLIHSRFRRSDRNRLEKELKDVYNKSTHACMVVSTQVVEVSLDISFDLMITETAPIDALIQRFGRINRKRSEETIGKYKPVYVIAPSEKNKDCLPYSSDVLKRSYEALPDNGLLEESKLQSRINQVYPDIKVINIDLDAVYVDGKWRLKELWHLPKSAFVEKLDIDSVTCITQEDEETGRYRESTEDERILMEIPVNYNSVRWKKLAQSRYGTHPFIVPDSSYSVCSGLDLGKTGAENYDTNYQML